MAAVGGGHLFISTPFLATLSALISLYVQTTYPNHEVLIYAPINTFGQYPIC